MKCLPAFLSLCFLLPLLSPVPANAVAASGPEEVRLAAGLKDNRVGHATARMLFDLGYTEIEFWRANTAARLIGPAEDGVPVPVLHNSATNGSIVLHETPAAEKVWNTIATASKFAARFSWSDSIRNGKPEGVLLVRPGGEPYHVAEEHFHHQFSRANLLRLLRKEYIFPADLPRVGDSEAWAATMAHRFLTAHPELSEWAWNGQADIAQLFEGFKTSDLLRLTLSAATDLKPLTLPSRDTGDRRPTRLARPLARLQSAELDVVGIDRHETTIQLCWPRIRESGVPWSAADAELVGLSEKDLRGL